jgi:hypothetical protein
MNDAVFIVAIVVGVILLIVGIAAYSAYAQRQRREAIQTFAGEFGLIFAPEDSEQIRARLMDFQLFKEGRGQRVYNVLRAEAEGVRMSIFDYQFTTGGGKSQHTHHQTVLLVEASDLHLPPITIRQENLFDAIAGVFGFRDIDFEDQPEFSRRFLVKSPNEVMTRKLFDGDIFDFFVARRDLAFEAGRNRLVVYRRGRIVKPADLKPLLADGLQLYNHFSSRLARLEQAAKTGQNS